MIKIVEKAIIPTLARQRIQAIYETIILTFLECIRKQRLQSTAAFSTLKRGKSGEMAGTHCISCGRACMRGWREGMKLSSEQGEGKWPKVQQRHHKGEAQASTLGRLEH